MRTDIESDDSHAKRIIDRRGVRTNTAAAVQSEEVFLTVQVLDAAMRHVALELRIRPQDVIIRPPRCQRSQ